MWIPMLKVPVIQGHMGHPLKCKPCQCLGVQKNILLAFQQNSNLGVGILSPSVDSLIQREGTMCWGGGQLH